MGVYVRSRHKVRCHPSRSPVETSSILRSYLGALNATNTGTLHSPVLRGWAKSGSLAPPVMTTLLGRPRINRPPLVRHQFRELLEVDIAAAHHAHDFSGASLAAEACGDCARTGALG